MMKRVLSVILLAMILTTAFAGAAFAEKRVYVLTTATCYIRSEPNKNSESYRTAKKGEYFLYEDSEWDSRGVEWYGIMYGSKGTAWISSKNAKLTKEEPGSSTPKPTAKPTPIPTLKPIDYSKFTTAGYYVQVTGKGVNMRMEPATDRGIVRAYAMGDVLYAVSTNGSWMEVRDEENHKTGYMSAKYLEPYEEPVEKEPPFDDYNDLTFAEMQDLAEGAVLVDAPEGATDVLYRWIDDQDVARIQFVYQGIQYILSARAGKLDSEQTIVGDYGDATQSVPTDGGIELTVSSMYAGAESYSAANDTSYALMGPSAANGSLVLDMAKTLFPEDCSWLWN